MVNATTHGPPVPSLTASSRGNSHSGSTFSRTRVDGSWSYDADRSPAPRARGRARPPADRAIPQRAGGRDAARRCAGDGRPRQLDHVAAVSRRRRAVNRRDPRDLVRGSAASVAAGFVGCTSGRAYPAAAPGVRRLDERARVAQVDGLRGALDRPPRAPRAARRRQPRRAAPDAASRAPARGSRARRRWRCARIAIAARRVVRLRAQRRGVGAIRHERRRARADAADDRAAAPRRVGIGRESARRRRDLRLDVARPRSSTVAVTAHASSRVRARRRRLVASSSADEPRARRATPRDRERPGEPDDRHRVHAERPGDCTGQHAAKIAPPFTGTRTVCCTTNYMGRIRHRHGGAFVSPRPRNLQALLRHGFPTPPQQRAARRIIDNTQDRRALPRRCRPSACSARARSRRRAPTTRRIAEQLGEHVGAARARSRRTSRTKQST